MPYFYKFNVDNLFVPFLSYRKYGCDWMQQHLKLKWKLCF